MNIMLRLNHKLFSDNRLLHMFKGALLVYHIWPHLQFNPVSSCSTPSVSSRKMESVDTPWNTSERIFRLCVAPIPTSHFLDWCCPYYQQRCFPGISRGGYHFSSFHCKFNFLCKTVLTLHITCKLSSWNRILAGIFWLNAIWLANSYCRDKFNMSGWQKSCTTN